MFHVEQMKDSEKMKFYEPANYSEIKPGTILRQRFTEIKIRYIFVEINENGSLVLIPIYTGKNTGEKWITDLLKMFAVADASEQFIEDFAAFDLEGFLKYLRSEQ